MSPEVPKRKEAASIIALNTPVKKKGKRRRQTPLSFRTRKSTRIKQGKPQISTKIPIHVFPSSPWRPSSVGCQLNHMLFTTERNGCNFKLKHQHKGASSHFRTANSLLIFVTKVHKRIGPKWLSFTCTTWPSQA